VRGRFPVRPGLNETLLTLAAREAVPARGLGNDGGLARLGERSPSSSSRGALDRRGSAHRVSRTSRYVMMPRIRQVGVAGIPLGAAARTASSYCAPDRNRTCDQEIRRLLLYPLSYRGWWRF
jgi:hypothetical protein